MAAAVILTQEAAIQPIFDKLQQPKRETPEQAYKTIELSKSHMANKLLDGEFQKLFHSLYIDESPRKWSNMAA